MGRAWAYRFPEQRDEVSHAFVIVIQADQTPSFAARLHLDKRDSDGHNPAFEG